jgi:hypothetical protein
MYVDKIRSSTTAATTNAFVGTSRKSWHDCGFDYSTNILPQSLKQIIKFLFYQTHLVVSIPLSKLLHGFFSLLTYGVMTYI